MWLLVGLFIKSPPIEGNKKLSACRSVPTGSDLLNAQNFVKSYLARSSQAAVQSHASYLSFLSTAGALVVITV